MTHNDILVLSGHLVAIAKLSEQKSFVGKTAFVYFIAKLSDAVAVEEKAIRTALAPCAAWVAFNKARIAACTKLATKDEKTKEPMKETVNGIEQYVLTPENQVLLAGDLAILQKEHEEGLKEQDAKSLEDQKFLEAEGSLKVDKKLKQSAIPDGITVAQMRALLPWIEE